MKNTVFFVMTASALNRYPSQNDPGRAGLCARDALNLLHLQGHKLYCNEPECSMYHFLQNT